MTLKDKLTNWTDRDTADLYLAQCLGLMNLGVDWWKAKHVFWADNLIGVELEGFLDRLVQVGVLRGETSQSINIDDMPISKGTGNES